MWMIWGTASQATDEEPLDVWEPVRNSEFWGINEAKEFEEPQQHAIAREPIHDHSASLFSKQYILIDIYSFSLSGHPTHWQNVALAGADGGSQGKVSKNSVSVLVDHF